MFRHRSSDLPMLSVSDLTVSYGPVAAVRGIDLTVNDGEVVALLGANGAGKTSTLSSIAGLVRAGSGTITFGGEPIQTLPAETILSRGLALVPEGRRVFTALTASENLRLGGATLSSAQEVRDRQAEMETLFPILKTRGDQLAGTLSGGQQQQLAIARALMSRPKCLLMDEPSLGLAPLIMAEIFDLIRRLRDSGLTILLVEQNAHAALETADRAYVLANGVMHSSGTAAEIAASEEIQAAYLGGEFAQEASA